MTRISEYYDDYWEQRDENTSALHREWTRQRIEQLSLALSGVPKSERVLDAGCGRGTFSTWLADLGFNVIGVDISATVLARNKQSSHGGFVAASLEDGLPFKSAFFAAIWFTEVIEHIFDVHRVLSELNRVLQEDGLLVLTTPYHSRLKNTALALHGFERHFSPYLSHIRFFTRRSLDLCLRNAGFTPLHWRGIGRRWPLYMSHHVVACKVGPPGPPPKIRG